MRRKLGQLFTSIKGPDRPAFVVLNDDSSDRLAVRELNTIDKIMRQRMQTLWTDLRAPYIKTSIKRKVGYTDFDDEVTDARNKISNMGMNGCE